MSNTRVQFDQPDHGTPQLAAWADRIATISHVSRLVTASLNMDELLATAIESITPEPAMKLPGVTIWLSFVAGSEV